MQKFVMTRAAEGQAKDILSGELGSVHLLLCNALYPDIS